MVEDKLALLRESPVVYQAGKPTSVMVDVALFERLLRSLDPDLPQAERPIWQPAPVAATGKVVALQDLRDPKLRLTQPLYVLIEDREPVMVSNVDLDIFGYGDTEDEAVQDFCECVVETYWDLKEAADRLGPHLQRIWDFLDRIVQEVEPCN